MGAFLFTIIFLLLFISLAAVSFILPDKYMDNLIKWLGGTQ